MEPKDWGGLLEIMYSQFEEKEIDEKIVKLKERLQNLITFSNNKDFFLAAKSFTKEECDYLNSPVLDEIFAIEKCLIWFPTVATKFVLNSNLQILLRINHLSGFTTCMLKQNCDKTFSVYIETRAWQTENKILPKDVFTEKGKVKEEYLYLLNYSYSMDSFVTPRKILEACLCCSF